MWRTASSVTAERLAAIRGRGCQPTTQPTKCEVLCDLQALWQSPRRHKLLVFQRANRDRKVRLSAGDSAGWRFRNLTVAGQDVLSFVVRRPDVCGKQPKIAERVGHGWRQRRS